MYYRLIKPSWGKRYIKEEENPDFVRNVKGPNIYEGCFSQEELAEKNAEGYNIYWFPNHPSESPYTKDHKYLSGKDIDVFDFVFVEAAPQEAPKSKKKSKPASKGAPGVSKLASVMDKYG